MDTNRSNRPALACMLLLAPAFALVSAGVLEAGFGLRGINDGLDRLMASVPALAVVIHPVVVMGGLLIAITANALPVIRLRLESNNEAVAATLIARRKVGNIAASLLGLILLGALLAYAFGENFSVVPR
jgi:hypothetical protein